MNDSFWSKRLAPKFPYLILEDNVIGGVEPVHGQGQAGGGIAAHGARHRTGVMKDGLIKMRIQSLEKVCGQGN